MPIKTITKETFHTGVLEASHPLLVEFWAPWCVYCKRLAPVPDRLVAKLGDDMPIGKINVDEQPKLEKEFDISVVSTLYLFKSGKHREALFAPSSQAQWIHAEA